MPTGSLTIHQLSMFLDVATEAAWQAGAILRSHFGQLESIEKKGASGNLVTEADHAAENVIVSVLMRHFPTHAILAEEGGPQGAKESSYLWAIDPLDGTTNYAHQYPVFGVSIGLLVDGVPQVGVIYDPMRQEYSRRFEEWGQCAIASPSEFPPLTRCKKACSSLGLPTTAAPKQTIITPNFATSPISPTVYGGAGQRPSTWPMWPVDG